MHTATDRNIEVEKRYQSWRREASFPVEWRVHISDGLLTILFGDSDGKQMDLMKASSHARLLAMMREPEIKEGILELLAASPLRSHKLFAETILTHDSNEANATLPALPYSSEAKVDACKDADTFFLSALSHLAQYASNANRDTESRGYYLHAKRAMRVWRNESEEPVLLQKSSNMGKALSCMSLVPVSINGFPCPAGSIIAIKFADLFKHDDLRYLDSQPSPVGALNWLLHGWKPGSLLTLHDIYGSSQPVFNFRRFSLLSFPPEERQLISPEFDTIRHDTTDRTGAFVSNATIGDVRDAIRKRMDYEGNKVTQAAFLEMLFSYPR